MKYDIVIVGGGMVGATLALSLQKKFRILLVDASPLAVKEDHRLIALNHTSICLFKNLNIWEQMSAHATKIANIHVSKRGNFGVTKIPASILGLDALGYVVPAKYINAALASPGMTEVCRPGLLKTLHQTEHDVILTIETPDGCKEFKADYVIGADGTHSTVRELLHIPTEKIDYEQSAIVTVTTLERSHENIAFERFVGEGAIAMLPLPNFDVATIWTEKNARVKELMAQSDDEFLQTLQKTFGYRLGRMQKIAKRYTYPLHFVKASESQKGRVFLLGNALHTMQPIAAQGLNLALYEIAMLVDYFSNPSGDFRPDPRHFSENLSHHLTWIFSSDFFLWNMARQVSMVAFDVLEKPKKYFLECVMGRNRPLPTLMRGMHEYT